MNKPGISRADITGLVLAGGRGARMGGVDKGLQPWHGRALALHALERLRPQVGSVLVSVNRNHEIYADWGAPLVADAVDGFAGPLAGIAAALAACHSDWLLCVPCDAPLFPTDLATRLAQACSAQGADIAYALAPEPTQDGFLLRAHPVFCLMSRRLAPDLQQYLNQGHRKVLDWFARHAHTGVAFDRADDNRQAFANINTLEQLQRMHTL